MKSNNILSNIDVKKKNRNKIFRYINSLDGVSRPEIAKVLGISGPTVLQNVKELLDEGYLAEIGEMKSTGGRKAVAIISLKNKYLTIGVDITRNHISIVIVNLSGEILHHNRIFNKFSDDETYYKFLSEFIVSTKEKWVSENSELIGIGISIPGIIDEEKRIIVFSHALSVHNLSFNKFTSYIPYPCEFINDANAACLAETYKNQDNKSFVYLSLSNSVGGSIILESSSWQDSTKSTEKIYYGENRRAGEFGHLTLYPDGKQCYCGKKGCVDSYCSAILLAEKVDGKLSMFFEMLDNGNLEFAALWNEYLENLAITVNTLRMAFDCTIIIGGYVGSYIEPYLNELKEIAKKRNTFEEDASYLEACKFKIEASATGAAIKQVERFLSDI